MQTIYLLFVPVILSMCCTVASGAGDIPASNMNIQKNIAYKSGENLSEYETQRCQLDLYVPADASGLPVMVWFHGGGLTGGDKAAKETLRVAEALASKGIIVAAVNYRLSPKAMYPAYLQDAAAAFAWVRNNAEQFGGDPNRCYIGGHSAGGYLAWMLGLDRTWLADENLTPGDVAGLIPVSGQTIVHSTVRKERGIPRSQMVVDEAAPLYHTNKTSLPILCICASDDNPMRCQENALLCAALIHAGCESVTSLVVDDRNHLSIIWNMPDENDAVTKAIVDFVNE